MFSRLSLLLTITLFSFIGCREDASNLNLELIPLDPSNSTSTISGDTGYLGGDFYFYAGGVSTPCDTEVTAEDQIVENISLTTLNGDLKITLKFCWNPDTLFGWEVDNYIVYNRLLSNVATQSPNSAANLVFYARNSGIFYYIQPHANNSDEDHGIDGEVSILCNDGERMAYVVYNSETELYEIREIYLDNNGEFSVRKFESLHAVQGSSHYLELVDDLDNPTDSHIVSDTVISQLTVSNGHFYPRCVKPE